MISENIERILLTEEQINEKVIELGKELSKKFEGKNPLVVSVLKGSYIFMADLTRKMNIPLNVDFMAISSYKNSKNSSGEVKIIKDLSFEIKDRHIIIVEDILDSGLTLNYTRNLLMARSPASITICTLLDKPERRVAPIKADYACFQIPDEFVVGYGLDYAECFRNLPYIGVVKL